MRSNCQNISKQYVLFLTFLYLKISQKIPQKAGSVLSLLLPWCSWRISTLDLGNCRLKPVQVFKGFRAGSFPMFTVLICHMCWLCSSIIASLQCICHHLPLRGRRLNWGTSRSENAHTRSNRSYPTALMGSTIVRDDYEMITRARVCFGHCHTGSPCKRCKLWLAVSILSHQDKAQKGEWFHVYTYKQYRLSLGGHAFELHDVCTTLTSLKSQIQTLIC